MEDNMTIQNQLEQFQKESMLSFSAIARMIGISQATLNLWRTGKYKGDNKLVEKKVRDFLDIQRKRANAPLEPAFVMTSTARVVFETLEMAQVMGKMVVITGRAGIGKTKAIEAFCERRQNIVLVMVNPTMNTHSLLMEIGKKVGASIRNDSYMIRKRIVAQLKNTPKLLIFDEAQQMGFRMLETVRSIHDETGVGIALVGALSLTDHLTTKLKETEQLWSRIRIKRELKPLTEADVRLLLSQWIEKIEDGVAQYVLELTGGNARQLTNSLMVAATMAKSDGNIITRRTIDRAYRYLMVA